jgi:hypothetical protein
MEIDWTEIDKLLRLTPISRIRAVQMYQKIAGGGLRTAMQAITRRLGDLDLEDPAPSYLSETEKRDWYDTSYDGHSKTIIRQLLDTINDFRREAQRD